MVVVELELIGILLFRGERFRVFHEPCSREGNNTFCELHTIPHNLHYSSYLSTSRITICLSIPIAILIVIPIIPPTYQAMLSFPFTNLVASMACRIFRNLKLHPPPGFEDKLPTISRINPSDPSSAVHESHISPWGSSVSKSQVREVQCVFNGCSGLWVCRSLFLTYGWGKLRLIHGC